MVNIEGRFIKYRYLFLTVGECRGYFNGVFVFVYYRLGRGSRFFVMVWSLIIVRLVSRNRSFYLIFIVLWRGGIFLLVVFFRWVLSKVRIFIVYYNYIVILYLGFLGFILIISLYCIWDSFFVLISFSLVFDVFVYL